MNRVEEIALRVGDLELVVVVETELEVHTRGNVVWVSARKAPVGVFVKDRGEALDSSIGPSPGQTVSSRLASI